MFSIKLPTELDARQSSSLIDDSVLGGADLPHRLITSSPKRKREFIAGRLCANRAVASLGSEQVVGMGSDRLPVWPKGIVGSISHSNSIAWAVACKSDHCLSIGIDTEPIATPQTVKEIADLVLCEDEDQQLRSLAESAAELLTIAFSLKESVYKCLYPIFEVPLDFHDIQLKPKTHRQIEAVVSSNEIGAAPLPVICTQFTNDHQNIFSAAWIAG